MAAGRVVLVTGVTGGIGRSLAVEFAKRGHIVIGCGRREESLRALQSEYPALELSQVDVTDDAQVAAWAAEVNRRHEIDLLVANAGVGHAKVPLWDLQPADFDKVMAANVRGVYSTIRHFVPQMAACKRGVIVTISSGAGRSTGATKAAYSASKFAVEAPTKSIAQSLPRGMAAVPLAPGALNTEVNPDPELPTPEAWAPVAVPFLLGLGSADNGTSLSVPGYYSEAYRSSWIIQDGQPLKPEAH
uniref:Ketoreductase domain-containing protein n=1 Tax=Pyrodinium bahamense TaxID=73915 RepID=A0A7S0AAQ6_9DINO